MPTPKHAVLRDARLKYNAAYAAYQSCVRAVNEATNSGMRPSQEMLEAETSSLRALSEARARMLAAMTELAGHSAAD